MTTKKKPIMRVPMFVAIAIGPPGDIYGLGEDGRVYRRVVGHENYDLHGDPDECAPSGWVRMNNRLLLNEED